MLRIAALSAAAVLASAAVAGPLHAQSVRLPDPSPTQSASSEAFTLDRMVEFGLQSSYRVRQLRLDVERRRSLLNAERARLKSRVQLELNTPEVESITETRWNSTLQRDELVAQNTRRIEMDFSVRQPVVLLGYPTNGVFSFNNRVYRYTQIDGIEADTQYYNRYFFAYDQPLFQPNRMKNSLERAQLNLEDSELAYQADIINMIDGMAEDYYDLLELAYRREVAARRVDQLGIAIGVAQARATVEEGSDIEVEQLLVEQANAIEDLNQTASRLRLQEADVKQRLQLPAGLDLTISPELDVVAVAVDELEAVELARSLAPRMRRLQIDVRETEIGLDETRGQNAFRMNVGVTYGREMQDPRLQGLWAEPRNSYTVDVRATVPIIDWGERRLRIEAQRYSLQRAELAVDQAEAEIDTRVRSEVRNLRDFLQRATNMEANLDMARRLTETTQERYAAREVGLVELMQALDRERLTAENFLGAYLGYQEALLDLRQLTFFDFESNLPVADRFPICVATGGDGDLASSCGGD